VGAGGSKEVGRAGLCVQEEGRRPAEQGGRVVRTEPDHLGAGGEGGPLRVAGERPHGPARGEETVDEGTADVAGRAGHYDHGSCLRRLG
jgi:hypothetical protein